MGKEEEEREGGGRRSRRRRKRRRRRRRGREERRKGRRGEEGGEVAGRILDTGGIPPLPPPRTTCTGTRPQVMIPRTKDESHSDFTPND